MTYGLKDLQAPYIQKTGTLGEMFNAATGMGMAGIYRLEVTGWQPVAKRYWDKFTHQHYIITIDKTES